MGLHVDKFEFNFDLGVFIGQLIGFAVIVFVIVKYVAPPIKAVMAKQQDQVRHQIAESEHAAAARKKAEQEYADAVAKARAEGEQLRAEAKEDSAKILAALREQTGAEVARVKQHGQEQALLHRQQLTRELRAELGKAVHGGASVIVQERLGTDAARSASIDSFIDELEALANRQGGAA
ncbi:ATPase [Segniliparus rugosus]|uniref:ATP synthase subunit b n=1 Tax=Segniliparus rugosus (strain ATCC BAA-974 / DSM 45345 / CCUG 50838 / CIP 108380 / JCM 13579 / CDC 945) TaxID=679197 RepID=E5XLJ6_SEGRC|nr:ATPase [Segniliparus rugosus]EFV14769.1 ATP synthase F0, B subunit [Segniliparus rugosus ATCC BAA-974]